MLSPSVVALIGTTVFPSVEHSQTIALTSLLQLFFNLRHNPQGTVELDDFIATKVIFSDGISSDGETQIQNHYNVLYARRAAIFQVLGRLAQQRGVLSVHD